MKKLFTLILGIALVYSCSSSSDGNSTVVNTLGPNLTDVDGNVYQTVTICDQVWTKSNLNVSKYRNGDVIPQVSDPVIWQSLTTGAWCYYANTTSNGTIYGKLYNWYAVTDLRGIAPIGYHIPTDAEWTILTNCLGGEANESGGKMKETGTSNWQSPNLGATNSSGFTGLPGGCRINGSFLLVGSSGFWWSPRSDTNLTVDFYRSLVWFSSSVVNTFSNRVDGYSVRCIKD